MTIIEQALLFGLVFNIIIWGYVFYKSFDRPLLPLIVRRTLRVTGSGVILVNILGMGSIVSPQSRELIETIGTVPTFLMTAAGLLVVWYWLRPINRNGI